MLQLSNLKSLTTKRKRIGRGGSRGGTSGRGHKGQRARTGSRMELKPFFEGGQMPLPRRLPRRGFVNAFKIEAAIVSLDQLEAVFQAHDVVTKEKLITARLVRQKRGVIVKILGGGSLSKPLTVHVDACSASAKAAIERVGGKVELSKECRGDSTTA
jgi:large subunit ribosomal protein L15